MTRFCACAATWFLFWRTVFQDWRLVKKSSSIDPETPEKAIISVFKSYLVHLGSFKRHILCFCASIVKKIRSRWGEPYEAMFVVVSVPTNGSNVAFNAVIWLSFLWNSTFELGLTTGSRSSKYKRRRTSELLCNIRNIRICMETKLIISVTYENERISLNKDLYIERKQFTEQPIKRP